MIQRQVKNIVLGALDVFRIIYIDGARQTGKTTFVKQLSESKKYNYVTFDDDEILNLSEINLNLFFIQNPTPLIIDEVQKNPKIINKIKMLVDNNPEIKGQFILTGSVDLLKSAQINESLAGRMVSYELYPFSFTELDNLNLNLTEILFQDNFFDNFKDIKRKNESDVITKLVQGSFPEVQIIDEKYRNKWFANYLKARINKDIHSLIENNLRKVEKIPELLKLLSNQTSNLLNVSKLASKLKISPVTVDNFIYLLEAMFLIEKLQPFEKNIGKQVKKTKKLYFTDTGLVSYLSKISEQKLMTNRQLFGQLLENYIYNELKKHISFSANNFEIFYYRDNKTYEVDFIIKNNKDEIIAIEVKSSQRVTEKDLKGLRSFKRGFEDKIKAMYVFYAGDIISAVKIDNSMVYLIPYYYIF